MISEERLKELIEQGTTIYYYKINDINAHTLKLSEECWIKDEELNYEYDTDYVTWREYFSLKDLYETKEEAEFVAKYHTSKVVKFEPPTWEEFLKTNVSDYGGCYSDILVTIYMIGTLENGKLYVAPNTSLTTHDFGKPTKENYYKAVEYAKKLFEGEQVE